MVNKEHPLIPFNAALEVWVLYGLELAKMDVMTIPTLIRQEHKYICICYPSFYDTFSTKQYTSFNLIAYKTVKLKCLNEECDRGYATKLWIDY
jgi:hypothetical protein